MKVLFAVNNENISNLIVKKYQQEYKEIISFKNVYYFNAILKEIQKDKSYDRIVISEDLEQFTNSNYQQMDKFIFDRLDSISDEASNMHGEDIPIILICSERRTKGEETLVKLFGIGIYNAVIGKDRDINEVCNLINKPRSKKEAKEYYKIDTDDVNYQAESENDVSEIEIQNILAHYKRLGKNEEKYVESFDNIALQYNDIQLKIICKFLPLNVRAVLEEKSPRYQKLMAFNKSVSGVLKTKSKQTSGTSEKLLVSPNSKGTLSKPVVIPTTVKATKSKNANKQLTVEELGLSRTLEKNAEENNIKPTIRETMTTQEAEDNITAKKGRGRPKKILEEENSVVEDKPKRGRGRPKKNPDVQEVLEVNEDDGETAEVSEFDNFVKANLNENRKETFELPGFENEKADILPGFEEDDDNIGLPGLEEKESQEEFALPGFEEDDDSDNDNISLPGFEEDDDDNIGLPGFEENNDEDYSENPFGNMTNAKEEMILSEEGKTRNVDISGLLTSDKKIVSIVGTSKNGTSFILNNLAELLSSKGINVAILDATQNRNTYYIYTKNEENLRRTAYESIKNLAEGKARGIAVNSNLTVYTSLPSESADMNKVGPILETLINNHSLILIDCDFNTPLDYFANSQEIYLVQSMDVLTIQPLTAFLRELKTKKIFDETKIRIIINKYVKLRNANERAIIGGMAYYNDPAMSFMTELFDRNMVKYFLIPFETEIYTKYLEGLINCDISLKGYSKGFMQVLEQLGSNVYPLLSGKNKNKSVQTTYGFSTNMNNTLNQMKKNY